MRCYTVQINPFQANSGIFDHFQLNPQGMLSLGGGPAGKGMEIRRPEGHIRQITDDEWKRAPLRVPVMEARIIVDGTEMRIYEADIRTGGNGEPAISYSGRESENILVLWDVRSSFGGTVELSVPDDVQVVTQQESIHADGQSYVRGIEILLILKPGQSVRASRTGISNLHPQSVLSFKGGCGGPQCVYEETAFPPDAGEEAIQQLSEFRT